MTSATKRKRSRSTTKPCLYNATSATAQERPPPSTTSASCTRASATKRKRSRSTTKPYRDVGDRAGEAATLTNIGNATSATAQTREATTLTNIGSVYSSLGDKKKALAFYNQALPVATRRRRPRRRGHHPQQHRPRVLEPRRPKESARVLQPSPAPTTRRWRRLGTQCHALQSSERPYSSLERDQEGFAALREAVHVGCRRGKPNCPNDAVYWFRAESIRHRQMAEARAAIDTLTNHVQRFDDLKSQVPAAPDRACAPDSNTSTEPLGSTILITRLVSGGPAARDKQLRTGDLIITYDGRPIRDVKDFPALVRSTASRPAVEIVVLRGVNRVPLQVQGGPLGVAIQPL